MINQIFVTKEQHKEWEDEVLRLRKTEVNLVEDDLYDIATLRIKYDLYKELLSKSEIISDEDNLVKTLFDRCKAKNYNCSIKYQELNAYSIAIYHKYNIVSRLQFYIENCVYLHEAIEMCFRFLDNEDIINEGK